MFYPLECPYISNRDFITAKSHLNFFADFFILQSLHYKITPISSSQTYSSLGKPRKSLSCAAPLFTRPVPQASASGSCTLSLLGESFSPFPPARRGILVPLAAGRSPSLRPFSGLAQRSGLSGLSVTTKK